MAEQQLPIWNSEGVEPPANLQRDGWQPGVKPPAQYFDWLFNRAYRCLEELQAITEALETNKANGEDLITLNNKVTQHLDETSGKHIHSSGNNANGQWIKFDDGTLICSVLKGTSVQINTVLAASIYTSQTLDWIMPSTFNVPPSISIIGANCWGKINSLDASILTYALLYPISHTSVFHTIIAIGRWK